MGMMINRRRVCGGEKLPYDAEIEYLEGDGTQYIDTGIIPLITDYVYVEFYLVTPLSNNDGSCSVYGVMSTWGKNAFAFVLVPHKNQAYALRGNATPPSITAEFIGYANSWQTQIIDNTIFRVFKGVVSVSNNEAPCLASAYLFCIHLGESSWGIGTSKRIRKFQHKRDGELIMDFIPVRVGNIGYMYDKVSGQLFGNAGTGNFILGPDK